MAITRRDFLGGTALAIAAGLTPSHQLRAETQRYYPPALTGLRGSHPGSFETVHRLAREGETFDFSQGAVEETYDLVVIGGGISGLAAAWFYREAFGEKSRILILENHDDFGGHAKRNEFSVDGHPLLIGYGGSESIESPKANFSKTVARLMESLGVKPARFDTAYDLGIYGDLGLTHGVFFDRETFGVDRLVAGNPVTNGADPTPGNTAKAKTIAEFVGEFPMSDDAKKRLIKFFADSKDYLANMSLTEKLEHLQTTSYRDYLKIDAGLGDEAVKYFEDMTHDYFALGTDAVPAASAMFSGYPGFAGLLPKQGADKEPYIYHFPDGNASIARLLVRNLVPGVAPGSTMEDIVLADFDYSKLDQPDQPVRIRLRGRLRHRLVVERQCGEVLGSFGCIVHDFYFLQRVLAYPVAVDFVADLPDANNRAELCDIGCHPHLNFLRLQARHSVRIDGKAHNISNGSRRFDTRQIVIRIGPSILGRIENSPDCRTPGQMRERFDLLFGPLHAIVARQAP